MFTDGVAAIEIGENDVFRGMMAMTDLRSVQEIADGILNVALAASGGEAKDDMTVMVTKVVEPGRARRPASKKLVEEL